jgi:hypothetical protein
MGKLAACFSPGNNIAKTLTASRNQALSYPTPGTTLLASACTLSQALHMAQRSPDSQIEKNGRSYDPPAANFVPLPYSQALETIAHHLMPIFITPRSALCPAQRDKTRVQSSHAYESFDRYMQVMVDALAARVHRPKVDDKFSEENLFSPSI